MGKTFIVIMEKIPHDNIQSIILQLSDPIFGVKVKDRKYHFKTYPQCFLGKDCVSWIQKRCYLNEEEKFKEITREEALKIGRELVRKKFIRHVVLDHDLKDEKLFYKFIVEEIKKGETNNDKNNKKKENDNGDISGNDFLNKKENIEKMVKEFSDPTTVRIIIKKKEKKKN